MRRSPSNPPVVSTNSTFPGSWWGRERMQEQNLLQLLEKFHPPRLFLSLFQTLETLWWDEAVVGGVGCALWLRRSEPSSDTLILKHNRVTRVSSRIVLHCGTTNHHFWHRRRTNGRGWQLSSSPSWYCCEISCFKLWPVLCVSSVKF